MRAYVPNEQGWVCSLLHKVRVVVVVVVVKAEDIDKAIDLAID
jgi:hypothetical protein